MSLITIVVLAIVVWMLLGRNRHAHASGQAPACRGFSWPTRMLGFAAILGGIWMFCVPRSAEHDTMHVDVNHAGMNLKYDFDRDAGDWQDDVEHDESARSVSMQPFNMRPFSVSRIEFDRAEHHAMPRWASISLATMLIITGAILAGRERTRPRAFSALTVLGVAAILFTVVSFFQTAPQAKVPTGPRVVAVNRKIESNAAPKSAYSTAPTSAYSAAPTSAYSAAPTSAAEGRATTRARRPTSRPVRPMNADAPLEMPPRAGEIPVEAELAASAPQAPANVAPAAPIVPTAAPTPPGQPQTTLAATTTAETTTTSASTAEVTAAPAPPTAEPVANEAPAVQAAPGQPTAAQPLTAETQPVAPATPPVAPATTAQQAPAQEASTSQVAAQQAPTSRVPVPSAAQPAASATRVARVPASRAAEGPRPDWVDGSGKLANTMVAIKSGLWTTMPECQRKLDQEIQRETAHYVDLYLGDGASQHVKVSLEYLKKHVQKAEYAEVIESETVGPMHQVHALLNFDDQTRADFHRLYESALVTDRLWYAGSGAALVLALLGTLYGYLKLGQRTDRAHHGRLQLAATLVALILAAGALLGRYTFAL